MFWPIQRKSHQQLLPGNEEFFWILHPDGYLRNGNTVRDNEGDGESPRENGQVLNNRWRGGQDAAQKVTVGVGASHQKAVGEYGPGLQRHNRAMYSLNQVETQ